MSKRTDGRVNLSFRFNGKVFTVTGKNKDDAYHKKAKRIEELKRGKQSRENPTLNQYYDTFTANKRSKVRESTIVSNRGKFRTIAEIVVPGTGKTLGEMHLTDIQAGDVQAVQNVLIRLGMSSSTINTIISHLSSVMNRAYLERVIDWNPCKAVESLKRTEPKAKDTIHRALTEKEVKAFFDAAKGTCYENAFKMLIFTGMRVGELGALLPSDFDTKEGVIHITKTVTATETGLVRLGDMPKTASSVRDIPLTAKLKQVFREQMKQNEIVHGQVNLCLPVFRSDEGMLLRASELNYHINGICEIAEIGHFSSHAFRATFATRFFEQEPENYKILSEILGHSNINMTLNLYAAHQSKPKQKEAFERFEIAL